MESSERQLPDIYVCPLPVLPGLESQGQRNLTIDPFGDNVLSVSNIPGGSFTARLHCKT